MLYLSSVTQKGQITIPKVIRDALNIGLYEKVTLELEDGYVAVKPTRDLTDIAGKYSPKNPKDPLKAREVMETTYERP